MKTQHYDSIILSSQDEKTVLSRFTQALKNTPLPDDELLANLGLYLSSKSLSRLLFFHEIYRRILNTHGVIMEFGVRWGQTLSIMAALRSLYEPFNRHRRIIGFDTFEGFKGMCDKDGPRSQCRDGSFSVSENYETYLADILTMQEQLNPMSHLRRFELVKGDAVVSVPEYLERHPETLVSLAVFDFDIYAPTKAALAAIKPHLFRGSILVFDELCDDIFPGETTALAEEFDLGRLRIERLPLTSRVSFIVIE